MFPAAGRDVLPPAGVLGSSSVGVPLVRPGSPEDITCDLDLVLLIWRHCAVPVNGSLIVNLVVVGPGLDPIVEHMCYLICPVI